MLPYWGCGQVVSVLTFYSNDLTSNPGEFYTVFFCKLFEKIENKQKEAGDGSNWKNAIVVT